MKPLLVVADVHGRFDALVGLLQREGVLDAELNRNLNVRCIQIGDLMNCVALDQRGDSLCLDHAERFFDKVLIGNHELPYTYQTARYGTFRGFYNDPAIGYKYRRLLARGFFVPAHVEGDILITHAGLSAADKSRSAKEAYRKLRRLWLTTPAAPLFTAVGHRRGGVEKYGGIFWCDYKDDKNPRFNQIFGHNAYAGLCFDRNKHHGTYCINLDANVRADKDFGGPAILAAAWIKDGRLHRVVKYRHLPQKGEG